MQKVTTDFENSGIREVWDFIEDNLADYSSNQNVCLSEDLTSYLTANEESSVYEKYKKQYRGRYDRALEKLIYNDTDLYIQAVRDSIKAPYFGEIILLIGSRFEQAVFAVINNVYKKAFKISRENR